MSDFRLATKQFFLTYPQCSLALSVATEVISNLFEGKEIEYGIVCTEDHKESDGRHLHAVIVLKKRWDIRNARTLDLIVDGVTYHGDYQRVKSLYEAIKYVCKDGNVEGINCDWKVMLECAKKKTSTKAGMVASMLMDGKSLKEINEKYPGFVLQHLNKLREYQRWLEVEKMMDTPKLDFNGAKAAVTDVEEDVLISKWINSNFGGVQRKMRQKQLWIWGPTSTGKTHLLLQLLNYFHGWRIPNGDKWDDGYSDRFDFAYADEFKGNRSIQWMNAFVEGAPVPLAQRGQAPYVKKKNMPVIICSNYSIDGCYENADPIVREALSNRFLEVRVGGNSQIDIAFEFDESDEDTCPMISDEDEMWECASTLTTLE